jgi:Cytochrome c
MTTEIIFAKRFLLFTAAIIIAITSLFTYFCYNPSNQNAGNTKTSPESFCGTVSTAPEKIKGKNIFNSNCAACHRIDAKGDILRNALKKFPSDQFFYNYVTAEDSLLQDHEKLSMTSNIMFEGDYNHHFNLSQNEIEELKKHIE